MNHERENWDARASTMLGARHEACSDPERWDESVNCLLSIIVPKIKHRSGHCFDLGCGPGRLTIPIAKILAGRGMDITGMDISASMIEHLCWASRNDCQNINTYHGDGRTLGGIENDHYSFGFSVNMFQHIPDDAVQGYLKEVCRVLKPGGIFVFQFVTGTERAPFMYQRLMGAVAGWCKDAGFYNWQFGADPTQRNWQWVAAKK